MKVSIPSSSRALALVLAADDSPRRTWAISSAVAMARRVSRARKVLLADLECREPSALATMMGEAASARGIVDVLFRGAPFPSIARRPPSEPFIFLPRGDDPPSVAVLYRHPGWKQIARRLQGKKAVFLACVSADDWAEVGPIQGFELCIVFNGTDGDVRLPPGARKIAEVHAPPEVRSRHDIGTGPQDSAVPQDDAVAAERAPGLVSHPAAAKGHDEVDRTSEEIRGRLSEFGVDPTSPRPTQLSAAAAGQRLLEVSGIRLDRQRRKRMISAVLVAVTAMALAATAWLTWGPGGCIDPVNAERANPADGRAEDAEASRWGEVSGCVLAELRSVLRRSRPDSLSAALITLAGTHPTPGSPDARGGLEGGTSACEEASDRASGGSSPADAGCEAATRRGVDLPLPYAVVAGEFTTLDAARRHLEESERIPVPFYLVPTWLDGAVRYRVFAGLLTDRLEAEVLLSRLVSYGIKDGVDIRHVRHTFLLGTFQSEGEARSVLERLQALDVPSYVVPAAASGDRAEPVYRVYAGAFEGPAESQALRESIKRAGLTAQLVERTGLVSH